MKYAIDQIVAAYSGYIKWIGIIVGSISILNWLVVTLDRDIFGAIAILLDLYEKAFYPIFLIPEYTFNIHISNRLKDAILFYAALGGVTSRTWMGLLARTDDADNATIGDYSEPMAFHMLTNSKSLFVRSIFLCIAFVVWPFFTRPFVRRPIMVFDGKNLELWLPSKEFREVVRENRGDKTFQDLTVIDVRVVWILQVLGMLIAALSAIGLHEFLTSN